MLLAVPTAPKTAIAKVTFSLVNNSCMKLKMACIIQPLFFWYLKNYNTKRGNSEDENNKGWIHDGGNCNFPKFHYIILACIYSIKSMIAGRAEIITQKGSEYMSEKEKKIVEKIKKAMPNLSEFDKGYFLGKVESLADEADRKAEDKTESKT